MVEEEVHEPPDPQPQRDLRVLEDASQHVRHVGDAPGPALDLVVLAHVCGRIIARVRRVSVERQVHGLDREPLAEREERLPVKARVLGNDVLVPVADLVHEFEAAGVAAERDQAMRPGVKEHLPLRGARRHDPHRHRDLPDVVVKQGHRLPDRVVAQRRPGMVPADPGEVLRMDAVVGVQVGDQHLVEPVPLLRQHPDHPASAPVHGGGFADDDPRLQRILDVVEAFQPAAELFFQPGHVLPARLVGLARNDADHRQLSGVVRIDDRLHGALEHVVRLRVGRDDAEVVVLERVV